MILSIEIKSCSDKPEGIETYRDKYKNPKQTNFIVWDKDGIPRFAVFEDGHFKYTGNKRVITNADKYIRVPTGEEVEKICND